MASNPTDTLDTVPRPAGAGLFGARPTTERRSKVGLDVLLTKAAVDFQNFNELSAERVARENLEALREAAGLDAIFIAKYCEERRSIDSIVSAVGMFSAFNPAVLSGEPLERLP